MAASTPDVRFGHREFSAAQTDHISHRLRQRLDGDQIATRVGPGGSKLSYLESHKAIELTNEVFQFNGWSCSIVDVTQDFIEEAAPGKCSVGISAIVRVTLQDGTYHEDIGFGLAENVRGRGMAIEKAKKEAITDARKRALRLFGNQLGNCVYDRDYVAKMKAGKPKVPEIKREQGPMSNFGAPSSNAHYGGASAKPHPSPVHSGAPVPAIPLVNASAQAFAVAAAARMTTPAPPSLASAALNRVSPMASALKAAVSVSAAALQDTTMTASASANIRAPAVKRKLDSVTAEVSPAQVPRLEKCAPVFPVAQEISDDLLNTALDLQQLSDMGEFVLDPAFAR